MSYYTNIRCNFTIFSFSIIFVGNFKVILSNNDVLTMVPNGEIILTKRLDYESLNNKQLTLNIEATSDANRKSIAKVIVEVIDINDNPPVFEKKVSILF